jgi:hypothetical protein
VVTQTGTNSVGHAEVSFSFTGSSAGLLSEQLNADRGPLSSVVDLGTMRGSAATTAPAPAPSDNKVAIIVGCSVAGVVLLVIVIAVIVKVSGTGATSSVPFDQYMMNDQEHSVQDKAMSSPTQVSQPPLPLKGGNDYP